MKFFMSLAQKAVVSMHPMKSTMSRLLARTALATHYIPQKMMSNLSQSEGATPRAVLILASF